jgi:hypothetical protein
MAKKFAQGIYEVANPQKYVGKGKPKYRSGWEMMFFRFCDNNPSILQWASESITIPYRNPLTGKQTIYIPDIFMVYENKHGQKIAEIIEIKPSSQTSMTEARSSRDKAAVVLNHAKWQAATAYCNRMGLKFRIVTENELFRNGKAR